MVEAVEALPVDAPAGGTVVSDEVYAALADELGDLLPGGLPRCSHRRPARLHDGRRGTRVHDKLSAPSSARVRRRRRGGPVPSVMRNWEQIKKHEKGTTSLVHGITPGLPSLLYTNKLFRKAASIGLEPGALGEALDRRRRGRAHACVGRNLEADLAAAARSCGRGRARGRCRRRTRCAAGRRYRTRFEAMERLATAADLAGTDTAIVAALWLEAAVAT